MGSASSTIAKVKKSNAVSKKCLKFCQCFAALTPKYNDTAKANRVQAWMALDNNGNGLVSLAETGKWVESTLIAFCGDGEQGKAIYKEFYPSYIRAFKDAADCGKKRAIGNKGTTSDDYVEKSEFRVLCVYLCLYAVMFDAFALIDGYQRGDADHKDNQDKKRDDRKISPEEWQEAYQSLRNSPFVALKMCAASQDMARAAFKEMDLDGMGSVLLMEFCEWIKRKEIAMNTDFGKILELNADQIEACEKTGIQKKMAARHGKMKARGRKRH